MIAKLTLIPYMELIQVLPRKDLIMPDSEEKGKMLLYSSLNNSLSKKTDCRCEKGNLRFWT